MKRKVLVCLLSVLLLLSLAGCGSTEQDPEPNDSQPSGEVEQQPDEASGPSVKYGELLELTDNRETNGVVIVKAKITPNATNKLTVAQNYRRIQDRERTRIIELLEGILVRKKEDTWWCPLSLCLALKTPKIRNS